GAFSPDGRQIVGCGPNGAERIWDVATGKKVRDLRSAEGNGGRAVFTPDGKRLLVGDMDDVCLLDLATGKPVHDFGGHTNSIWSVFFTPDGGRLITRAVYTDQTVRVWDPRTGRKLGEFEGGTSDIRSMTLSPDGKAVASAGGGQTIRLRDAAT